jgi:dienelactone hydrolase
MPVVPSAHELGKGENMARIRFLGIASAAALIAWLAAGPPLFASSADRPERRGEVAFKPDANEQVAVPKPFQLKAQTFEFQQQPKLSISDDVSLSLVTFPSPVKTKYESNNTVHCEYYCPTTPGKHPACIVLHILGGDFPLARTFATALAHRGVASLFVIMPYYGPRRPPDANVRMISGDPQKTVDGMTQAVKDIRFGAAWLAAQPEVDQNQIGVFGISLGGITAALAGAAEPRFHKICPVLAGGSIASVIWDSTEPHAIDARKRWLAGGGTRDSLVELLKTVDPACYGDCVHGRKILMLNASHDEVIPKKCTEALWQAFGRPQIYWYNAGHYSAMWHIVDAIGRVTEFFQSDGQAK